MLRAILIWVVAFSAHAGGDPASTVICQVDLSRDSFLGISVGSSAELIRGRVRGQLRRTTWPDEGQSEAIEVQLRCGVTALFEVVEKKVGRILILGESNALLGLQRVSTGMTLSQVLHKIPKAVLSYGIEEGGYVSLLPPNSRTSILFHPDIAKIEKAIQSPTTAKEVLGGTRVSSFFTK